MSILRGDEMKMWRKLKKTLGEKYFELINACRHIKLKVISREDWDILWDFRENFLVFWGFNDLQNCFKRISRVHWRFYCCLIFSDFLKSFPRKCNKVFRKHVWILKKLVWSQKETKESLSCVNKKNKCKLQTVHKVLNINATTNTTFILKMLETFLTFHLAESLQNSRRFSPSPSQKNTFRCLAKFQFSFMFYLCHEGKPETKSKLCCYFQPKKKKTN